MTRDIFLGVGKCQIFVFAKMKNDHTQSRMIIQVSELSGHVERHFSPLQLRSVLPILVFHQNSRKWKNTPKMLWAWDFPLYGDPKSLDMPSLWRSKMYFVAECGWCFSYRNMFHTFINPKRGAKSIVLKRSFDFCRQNRKTTDWNWFYAPSNKSCPHPGRVRANTINSIDMPSLRVTPR